MSDDTLLNAGQVAELLNVPQSWVRRETREGRMPHVPLGRYKRYVRGDVLDWIEKRKKGGGFA